MNLAFLGTRAGKFAAIGLAIVLAIVAFNLWLGGREKAAVDADRADGRAAANETLLGAERAAGEAVAKVQADNAVEAAKTRDAMKEAADRDPAAAKAPAGAVSRAAAERLRDRQR